MPLPRALSRAARLVLPLALFLAPCAAGQQRPAITGISHVAFYSRDKAALQRFYGAGLGFRQDPHLDWSFHINATQGIEIEPPPTPLPGALPVGRLAHLAFATSDCEAMRAVLAAQGVAVEDRVSGTPGGTRWFGFRDAAGNPFEFVQSAPFRDPLWEGRGQRLAEVGFVVRDAVAEARLFGAILGFRSLGRRNGRWAWQVPGSRDVITYAVEAPGARRAVRPWGVENYVVLTVADPGAVQRRLRAQGWRGPALVDPDGNRIRLAAATRQGKQGPKARGSLNKINR